MIYNNVKTHFIRIRNFFDYELSYTLKVFYFRWRFRNESVFSVIHRTRSWGNSVSVSGGGSDLIETNTIRTILPTLLKELDVRSLLDAPCGDYLWMSEIQFDDVRYYGVDIVESIISDNTEKYASHDREFSYMDITKDQLPRADIILCRDCMVHLSNRDIWQVIKNFKRSGAKYLLATTYPGTVRRNRNIITGMWRYLDLQRPPFDFPSPIKIIDENTNEDYRFKSLGLWKLSDIVV